MLCNASLHDVAIGAAPSIYRGTIHPRKGAPNQPESGPLDTVDAKILGSIGLLFDITQGRTVGGMRR